MPRSHITRRLFLLSSITLWTVAQLSSPAIGAETKPAGGKDKVKLIFAWPKNLKGSAVYNSSKTVTSTTRTRKQKMKGKYDFRVRPIDDGLVIKTENAKLELEGAPGGAGAQAKLRDFILKLASSPPDFVVNRQGAFQRIDGLQRFQQRVESGMRDLVADFPPQVQTQIQRMVAPMISPAQLQQQMVAQWNRDVGFWTGGAEIDHNDTYVVRYSNRIPAFGNLAVPMATRFRFVNRVPCTKNERAKRCVELETKTKIDDKELTKAIEKMVAQGAPGQTMPKITDMRIDINVTLVTEPGTLIPHRVREEKITVASAGSGDRTQQVEVTEIDFKY